MELFKRFFNKRYREEFSKEISLKLNEEQYDYESLYFSIFKEIEENSDTETRDNDANNLK